MPYETTYPNSVVTVDLIGEERQTYLQTLVDTYNELNGKGYPIPLAYLREGVDGGEPYVELEHMEGGASIGDLMAEGKLELEKARGIYAGICDARKRIREKEGITIYNNHRYNTMYNMETGRACICDLTQCSRLPNFAKVRKYTAEHLEKMRIKNEELMAQEEGGA